MTDLNVHRFTRMRILTDDGIDGPNGQSPGRLTGP
jgi:hypothetical protein